MPREADSSVMPLWAKTPGGCWRAGTEWVLALSPQKEPALPLPGPLAFCAMGGSIPMVEAQLWFLLQQPQDTHPGSGLTLCDLL